MDEINENQNRGALVPAGGEAVDLDDALRAPLPRREARQRRAAAERALRALVEASREKKAAAKGKQAMVVVE